MISPQVDAIVRFAKTCPFGSFIMDLILYYIIPLVDLPGLLYYRSSFQAMALAGHSIPLQWKKKPRYFPDVPHGHWDGVMGQSGFELIFRTPDLEEKGLRDPLFSEPENGG